jgi:hypothetical protein
MGTIDTTKNSSYLLVSVFQKTHKRIAALELKHHKDTKMRIRQAFEQMYQDLSECKGAASMQTRCSS